MTTKICLPKAKPGKVILLDKYVFVDGCMTVTSEADVPKIMKILGTFYGCKVQLAEVASEPAVPQSKPPSATLSKEATKS